jgi:hypothetical protein
MKNVGPRKAVQCIGSVKYAQMVTRVRIDIRMHPYSTATGEIPGLGLGRSSPTQDDSKPPTDNAMDMQAHTLSQLGTLDRCK